MNMDVRNHTENAKIAEFLERLVHDMREPLRSVGAFAELLAEVGAGKLGEEGDLALREMPAGVSRIRTLLDSLSAYALALGEPDECNSPASLQSAFKIVVGGMDQQIRACGATVTAENLPTVSLRLERAMQLLGNLVGNSLRFRSEAAPVVRISAVMEDPGMWTIRVEDNGIGVPPGEREAVFRPFARGDGRKYGGAGLGLTIAKAIVEARGGNIRLEPASGGGSICVFTLPEA
jgi:signal transduction histidine kinase